MGLLENLKSRHAVKAYDPKRPASREALEQVLEAIALAPTSSGLQPFKVFVVQDQATKEEISTFTSNVDCARECTYILVLAAWDHYTEERIDEVYTRMAAERNLPADRFVSYTNCLKETYCRQQTPEENHAHAARQTYIAMGLALAQAAELGIGSTPIEGFRPAEVDRILDLPAKGYRAVTMIYLGHSDPERDWMAPMKKVRRPMSELVAYI